MPDLNAIPGMTALRSQTKGDPRIKIAVLDGPIDLDRACFQGANITRLDPYWSEEFPIDPQHLQAFLDVEKSGKSDEEKEDLLKEAIPDENIRASLHLRFHANHIISTICGQPGSPVEGIAPNATVINIPIAYSNDDFINPLNLSRAISTAIEQGVNIIHCAACHPTQSGLAHEFIDKAIRQAQANNILVIAPGGNDKGECWCVPAVLENVLTVGAMKDTGEPFKFSNFGGKYASQGILAPGENILGAQPGTDDPIRKKGTSCAAPIVTGTAALLMSLQLEQGLSPDAEAVRAALINSAIPCDPKEVEEPERCLLGKINIAGAYELLTGEPLKEVEKQGKEETAEKEAGEQLPVTLVSPQSPVITAISNLNNLENGMIPSNVTENSTSVTISEKQQISNTIVPSNITPSQRSNLVYVLGTLGYDFGTEARRDTFKQLMPTITIDNLELPPNPYDARQMVDYLESNLSETKSLIWTVNLELTPIYAIKPVGAFAAEIYQVMQYMLAGQILPEADEDYVERVSIPGMLTEETVRLFSGQIVPVIKVNSPRGMYGWKVNTLIESAIETVRTEHEIADEARMRRSLTSFLNRIYYDLRNVGQIARDRALNFAATNAFQAVQTFSQAVAMGMELHSIEVEKSPFCRYGSECWDVKLKFFDPENGLRAKRVFRFTIDVSDRTPVTLGEVRSWAVSK
ncbi:Peptidase S8 and S53, subtilisin, kexin, sedolisin [Microcystis aeruginosa PCC 9807]|uniref:Peptidase S8 and S53, subtilisin, kexin, sedolisin n=1 Tax=Microcystis aeruginosa PCC 9807 TaxID=1160283 RepID=I4H9V8_MICAE|nr:PatA/PatG family cyanobactin maturation protease [Microcystis aeruginosa]CCI18832.1 Peptidase S8 and S53, subtilisin, kexin, sedolisin [Microcystis aeruginosa PCC 9807]